MVFLEDFLHFYSGMRFYRWQILQKNAHTIWKFYILDKKQLYMEVRYARDTSLSLPKTSDLFRLKGNRNPPVTNYAMNLMVYLENICCKISVSNEDLLKAQKYLQDN